MISIREVRKVDLTKLASIYVRAYNSLNIGEKWEESRALKLMNWFYKKQSDLFL